ncbi:MAG: double-strand break repair protein AddB [Paracoccaceae bacterium]|nr:double-strand break repair protein AddB [Paracoccaceae bacterium]
MFSPQNNPRVFAVHPGCDFANVFVDGLLDRMKDANPEDMARVEIYLTTNSLRQAVIARFIEHKNTFIPKLSLLTDLKRDARFPAIPLPASTLRIRLELMQIIKKLLEKDHRFASHLAQYELTKSLESLLQELNEENIGPDELKEVDQTNLSSHWKESLKFLEILTGFVKTSNTPSEEARLRLVIDALVSSWETNPPDHPVIVAGSTGSVGATQYFMQKVASLPQGALVLPCFDFDLPEGVWEKMESKTFQIDHPQYRFYQLAINLGILPGDIPHWTGEIERNLPRNSLISLALRPAPVTNQWQSEGPKLANLKEATEGLTLVEAPSLRIEAVTIALQMKKALEDNRTAALVTPDRSLIRRVKATLRKWNLNPRNSRNDNLLQTSMGTFLQSIANLMGKEASPEEFVALLKHPLTNSGPDQENHKELASDLEYFIRSKGPEYDPMKQTYSWSRGKQVENALEWFDWFKDNIDKLEQATEGTLKKYVSLHKAIAANLAEGPGGQSALFWGNGDQATKQVENLFNRIWRASSISGTISSNEYIELFYGLASEIQISNSAETTPNLYFWNTEDARMQSPDLLIAGGMNEGSWPRFPGQDPWLNRNLRSQIGLNLPETRIGLMAHDFQQIVSCKEVILSRSTLGDGDPTTPSRWLSRLKNLLSGLDPEGITALESMKARGDQWLLLAENFEKPQSRQIPYSRPQPSPPLISRPKKISVTAVRTLITDPYAIYARDILKFKPVYRLKVEPSYLLRGIKLHTIMEQFMAVFDDDQDVVETERLMDIAREVLSNTGTLPVVEEVWLSTLEHNAKELLKIEKTLRTKTEPEIMEVLGEHYFENLDFTLTAKCDRIDVEHEPADCWHLFDYKSGAIPSTKQIVLYEKQIPLQAIMAEKGAFDEIVGGTVSRAAYIGIGRKPELREVERWNKSGEDTFMRDWNKFQDLVVLYQNPTTGYISRRYGGVGTQSNDYDHLARYGEWEDTDEPLFQRVGDG